MGTRAVQAAGCFPGIQPRSPAHSPYAQGEHVHGDEANNCFVFCCSLVDYQAAVGVPDEYDRLVDSGDHVAHVGGIAGDAVQRIRHRHDIEARNCSMVWVLTPPTSVTL